MAQVFSCEFCKISKNTFSYRTPLVAASVVFVKHFAFFKLVQTDSFHCNYFRICFYHLFNRDMQLFEMVAFIIGIIWIFSNILLMFIYLKRFTIIVNGLLLILYDSVSALKQFLSLTLLEVNNEGMCS